MAKRREDRYQTPAEAAAALAEVLATLAAVEQTEPTPAAPRLQTTAESSSTSTEISTEGRQAGAAVFADLASDTPADAPPRSQSQRQTRRGSLLNVVGGVALLGLVALVVFLLLPGRTPPVAPAPVVATVQADQLWQDTGVEVSAGDSVTVSAAGRWGPRGQPGCLAGGVEKLPRERTVLSDAPAFSLLGRVGNGKPFGLGVERTFRPEAAGRLFVQANDLDLENLTGKLDLTIKGGRKAEGEAVTPALLPVQSVAVELKRLERQEADLQSDRDKLRAELLAFVARHNGPAHDPSGARRAAELLQRLPSALDKLRGEDIPEYERKAAGDGDPDKAPVGLVAVLGDSRLKHWSGVNAVAYRPDGKRLASSGGDGRVVVWDTASGRQQLVLRSQGGPVVYSPDVKRLAAPGPGGTVKVWDADTGRELLSLKGHTQPICCLAFSPDGKRLASGSKDPTDRRLPGQLKVWDLETGEQILDLPGHTAAVLAVAFRPDGKTLASGGPGQPVQLWDLSMSTEGRQAGSTKGRQAERSLPAGESLIRGLAFSPDGRRLVAVSDTGSLCWDVVSGKETFKAGGGYCLAFSPAGSRVAVCGSYGRVTVLDADSGKAAASFKGLVQHVWGVAFSPDGKYLAAAAERLSIWDVATGQERFPAPGHGGPVRTVAVTPDGSRVASWSYDTTVKLWDVIGRAERLTLQDPVFWKPAAFSADGRLVAAAHWSDVRGWALPGGKAAFTWKKGPGEAPAGYVAASPNGKFLALRSEKGIVTVRVVDREGTTTEEETPGRLGLGKEVCTFDTRSPGPAGPVSFSPDGRRLAANGDKNSVGLWDAGTGQPLQTLSAGQQLHSAPAFSPDGRRVAAGDVTGSTWVWDLSAKAPQPLKLTGGGQAVTSVAFAPDGRTLVSSDGGLLILWDVASGQRLREWRLAGESNDVAFASDGRHLITGNANGTLYVIRLGPPATVVRPWQPPAHSPLDELRHEQIPEDELRSIGGGDAAKAPAELVAVLGDSHLRHYGPACLVAWGPDGKWLVSSGCHHWPTTAEDKTVRVWDVSTSTEGRQAGSTKGQQAGGRELLELHLPDCPSGLATAKDPATGKELLAIAYWRGGVSVRDPATGKEVRSLRHPNGNDLNTHRSGVAFSRDGRRLAAGGNKTITVWDTATWEEVRSWEGHPGVISGVAFSPDGTRLGSSAADPKVRVWDAVTGKQVLELDGPGPKANYVPVFSPDGTRLYAHGDLPRRITRAWDVDVTREIPGRLGKFVGDGPEGWGLWAVHPDGKSLAAAQSPPNGVGILDAVTLKLVKTLATGRVNHVAYSPDGSRLATVDDAGRVRIWDLKTDQEVPLSAAHGGPVSWGEVSPGGDNPRAIGTRLVSSSSDQTVRLWDTRTGKNLLTLPGDRQGTFATFGPDGKVVLRREGDPGTLRLGEAMTGRQLLTLPSTAAGLFSPDGTRVVSFNGSTSAIQVWDAVTARQLVSLETRCAVVAVVFGPDGRHLALLDAAGDLRLWDLVTREEGSRVARGATRHFALAFTPDGSRLAWGFPDGTVRLHDADTGEETGRLPIPGGPTSVMGTLAFHPSGRQAAVVLSTPGASSDELPKDQVILWDVDRNKQSREWTLPGAVTSLSFAPDGRHLITGNANGTLYVLRLAGPPER
jgi:WD40 repeat protein